MIKSLVDPACTGQFSKLFLDYISKNPNLKSFYNVFPCLENFQTLIQKREFDVKKRQVLHQALKIQYQNIEEGHAIHLQIDSLLSEKTFTVTTGHQLNLLTGPLYFIYKIISTINLAKKLKTQYPDYHFVPVYWMASEDHDFEEINYFKYEGKKYQWQSEQKGPVGEFQIDENLKRLLQEMVFVPDFLKAAFRDAKNLSAAVHAYVHSMFGEEGLVILDANTALLKQQFVPVLENELFDSASYELVNKQSKELEKIGYKTQITPRPINLFYMDKGVRERIEKSENGFEVINTTLQFSNNEMRELIKNEPEKLSPNVVLRPVYQEAILPNLAYLGGPAEVIYWLQLKPVFDHFTIPFPAILPRNFATWIDPSTQRKIKSLKLTKEDLFMDFDEWKKDFVQKHSLHDLSLLKQKDLLQSAFESASQVAKEIDITLDASFKAYEIRANKMMQHLAVKLRKAEQRKMSDQLQQMKAIQDKIFPNGSPQERVVNFLEFYLEDAAFFENLFAAFDPFDFRYILLEPHHDQS
jgi:bacillithiol synthase